MKNSEPSTSSPAPEEGFFPTSSLGMFQFARSNGTPTVAPSCASGPRKDGSPVCKCSRETFGCSTHPTGRDEWISSMRGSLASLTPLLESARGQMMIETSGRSVSESLGKFDPDGSFWKTSLDLFQTGSSEPSSVTWPASGMMRGGRCWELTRLAPRTGETAGGVWPTPCVVEPVKNMEAHRAKLKIPRNKRGGGNGINLGTAVKMWPTPDGNMSRGTQENWKPIRPSGQPASYTLNQAVRDKMWPTPRANKVGGVSSARFRPTLEQQVKIFPTPRTPSPTGGGTGLDGGARARAMLTDTERKELCGGKLNPRWVAWLMAFPIGWTDSKAWETRKSRSRRRSRLKS
jgi:DNA (cytosine-5)-methyltransferase 1